MAGKVITPFTDEEILSELKKLGHCDVSPEIFQLMKKDLSNLMAKDQRYMSSHFSKNSRNVNDSATANTHSKTDIKLKSPIRQQLKTAFKTSEEESSDSFSKSPTSSPSVDARISKYKNSFAAYKLKKNAVYPSDTIHETENDVHVTYGGSPIRKYRSTLNQYRAEKILNSPVSSVSDSQIKKKSSSSVTNGIDDQLDKHEVNNDTPSNCDKLIEENDAKNDSRNNSPIRKYLNLRHSEKQKESLKFKSNDDDSNLKTNVTLNKYKDSLNRYKMRTSTFRNCNEKENPVQLSSSPDIQNNDVDGQKMKTFNELHANNTTSKNSPGNKLLQNSGKMKTFIKSNDFVDHVNDGGVIPIITNSVNSYGDNNDSISAHAKYKDLNAQNSVSYNSDVHGNEISQFSRNALLRYNEIQSNFHAKEANVKIDKGSKNGTTKGKNNAENNTFECKPSGIAYKSEKNAKHLSDDETNDDEAYNSSPNLESIQMYKDSVNMFKLKKKNANVIDLGKQAACNSVSPNANAVDKYKNSLCNLKLKSYIQSSPRYANGMKELDDFSPSSTFSSVSKKSKVIKRKILRHVNGVAVVTEEMLKIPVIMDTSYPESDSLPSNKSYSSDDLSFRSNDSTGSVIATSPKAISNSQSTLSLTSLPLMSSRIPIQRKKKNDPVAMYGYYQKYWKNFKPPGEKTHDKLRWAVRDKMLEYHL